MKGAQSLSAYLLAIFQPDGPVPPPEVLAKIMRDVGAVRDRMKAAGVHVLTGGLTAASSATVLRPKGQQVVVTDGPFTEAKEHIGGFTVIRVPDLDAAMAWARQLAIATTLPVEVRAFQGDV